MIVKRQEKDGKVKAMYSSSTVAASTYDQTTGDLTVIFNNGGVYMYPNVAKTDYTRFELAESTGSDFNTYIKKKYPSFTKKDSMPVDKMNDLLGEIKKLFDEQTSPVIEDKEVIANMLKLIAGYVEMGAINPTHLSNLTKLIADYSGQNKPQLAD